MGDMSEYYRQISEIHNAVREREMYRLELEKERLIKTQRREKRHEDLRNKIKALHQELVTEELEASQRVRKLLAQVEAVTREHKLLEEQTEKLRDKKRQYEAKLEKKISTTKNSYPNYLSLLQTANIGSLGVNIPGIFPQATNVTSVIPQAASTPVPSHSMSTLHPFPAAIPQVSPIPLSNQWSVHQSGGNTAYGNATGNTSIQSQPAQHGAPHLSLNIMQQEELARRNITVPNGIGVSSAPMIIPGVSTQGTYQQNHINLQTLAPEQLGQNNPMGNSLSVSQGQNMTTQIAQQTLQAPTVSFNEPNHLKSSHSLSSPMSTFGLQHLAETPSSSLLPQDVHRNPTAYSVAPQIQDSMLSEVQGQEKSAVTNYVQPIDSIQNSQIANVPYVMENIEANVNTAHLQMPTDPSHKAVAGPSTSPNQQMRSQQSEEASTSTGLPTRPTVTGISEAQSIDSVHANNEMTEESLPPSTQEHLHDIPQGRNSPDEQVKETATAPRQEETSSHNLGKVNTIPESVKYNLPPNEKSKDPSPALKEPEKDQTEIKSKPSLENAEIKNSGKDMPKHIDSGKVATTKENALEVQDQNPIQTAASDSTAPTKPIQNQNSSSPNITASTTNQDIDNKTSAVQVKKDSILPANSEQREKNQVNSRTQPSVSEVKKPSTPADYKKTVPNEKKEENIPKAATSKVKVSQPSVSSVTDSSSTMATPSLPTKSSLSRVQPQDDENDSDFFDRDVPITATSAYKAMVSGTGVRGPGASTESDSDDVEGQMNAMIAKKDQPKSRPMFKPFASSIPSLRPPPPGTDTDSVDSVEAAIQAAMSKSKDQGDKTEPTGSTTTSNKTENTPTPKASTATKAPITKPRPSAALQINLDSDSESGGVSAGADGSDDDDFDFYD